MFEGLHSQLHSFRKRPSLNLVMLSILFSCTLVWNWAKIVAFFGRFWRILARFCKLLVFYSSLANERRARLCRHFDGTEFLRFFSHCGPRHEITGKAGSKFLLHEISRLEGRSREIGLDKHRTGGSRSPSLTGSAQLSLLHLVRTHDQKER